MNYEQRTALLEEMRHELASLPDLSTNQHMLLLLVGLVQELVEDMHQAHLLAMEIITQMYKEGLK